MTIKTRRMSKEETTQKP